MEDAASALGTCIEELNAMGLPIGDESATGLCAHAPIGDHEIFDWPTCDVRSRSASPRRRSIAITRLVPPERDLDRRRTSTNVSLKERHS